MSSQLEMNRKVFREEATELLTELEASLLELEETPDDMDLISRVFRAMHTIKGSGAMFGFDAVSKFTHDIETVYDLVRNGEFTVTKHLIDNTLKSCDLIRTLLDDPDSVSSEVTSMVAVFRAMVPKKGNEPAAPVVTAYQGDAGGQSATYRVLFKPDPDMFRRGIDPLGLVQQLAEMGEARVIAKTKDIPPLSEMDPEVCYVSWDVLLTTTKDKNALRDIFIFVEDDCEVKIELIDDGTIDDEGYKKLGEILYERGDISTSNLQTILGERKKLGEMLVDAGVVSSDQISAALAEQEHVRQVRQRRQQQAQTTEAGSIRVPSEKLDKLVDLVGELVTVQARLSQTALADTSPELVKIAEEVERLTAELRDNTMSIRMVQIGSTFSKFRRLVRDLSAELGKQINLETSGAETELDKTVIERLNDPLVHLIRNSIDHGVESPDVRAAAGKSPAGTVKLSARHSGAHVLITIADDGKGIDPEVIRRKAIEKKLISPDAELTLKETFDLIFAPGFSTAEKVSSVSGRGVGMDVVRKNIEALRGMVEISSKLGEGTVITLKLPLTLAIIDGLLVQIGGDNFVLPLSIVEECVELTRSDVENAHGRNIAKVRGELIPYIRLRSLFDINSEMPEIEQIVITELEGNKTGFVVDSVIGEHQTVIKTLGVAYKNVEAVSGATILGDGSVALILDASKILQKQMKAEAMN